MGIYGNVSFYQPHTKFNITETFNSRAALVSLIEDPLPEGLTQEEIKAIVGHIDALVNKYVLVDYTYEEGNYKTNHQKDKTRFGNNSNFDLTVWQVRLIKDIPHCIAIARMHSVLPTFEVHGSYRFDVLPAISAGDYFGKGKSDHM